MCDTCQKHKEEAEAQEKANREFNRLAYNQVYDSGNAKDWHSGKTPMPPPYAPPKPWDPEKGEENPNDLDSVRTGGTNEKRYDNSHVDEPTTVIPEQWDRTVGFKDDKEKVDLTYLPFRPLLEICRSFMFGAKKYDRDNWRKGMEHNRLWSACVGHMFSYNEGEDMDEETRNVHLANAGCMLLALMELRHTHPELDHRTKKDIKLGYGR